MWRVLPSLYFKGIVGRCRKEIGISLLQQNQVTPQVLDTEQYNIELISEPLEKYSDLLPGYTRNNCILFPMLILVEWMAIVV